MDTPEAPRDDLVRAVWPGAEYRADRGDDDEPDDGLGTLAGHFSVYGAWYEVDSAWEGRFMERIAPGAFTDTIAADRAEMRVLFQHGQDPQVGDKPLGPIDVLEEDTVGPRYEVSLLDTAYNRELKPGLEAGLYGASMRFSVTDEEWDDVPRKTKANPDKLPERTITKAKVFEFGPVTFPASPSATAGVRSLTDRFRASPVEPAPEPAPPAPAKEVQVDTKKSDMVPDNPVDPIDEYRTKAEMDEAIAARNERMAELDTEFQGRAASRSRTRSGWVAASSRSSPPSLATCRTSTARTPTPRSTTPPVHALAAAAMTSTAASCVTMRCAWSSVPATCIQRSRRQQRRRTYRGCLTPSTPGTSN
jgi:HK97 family phage prohead protease